MKILLINLALLILTVACSEIKRDKRTIDFVIRGFADVFGYDVLKRPSIVTTPAAPAAPTAKAAPGAPKAAPPTFFPPPVAPLPPPKFPLIPRATTPAIPPSTAQPKVTAPPLLTETIRKSFNLNINWNRNVPPPTTAAMPTVKVPAPSAAPAAPQTQAPVGKNNAVPLTEQNIQYLYDDIEPHRFKAINDNSYNDYEEPKGPPVAQVLLSGPKDDPYKTYQQSKDKLRGSITDFWNHSPYFRDEKGYKFLTTPETNDVVTNLEPDKSRYEEYELGGEDDKQELNDEEDSKEYADHEEENEHLQYNDIDEDQDDRKESTEEKDKYKTAESKETAKFPKKNATTKVETIIVTKTSCNHAKTNDNVNDETKNPAYQNTNKEDSSEIILPQFSGVLPRGIDHLSLGDKNRVPWPIPFDTEASETKNTNKRKQKRKKTAQIDPRRRIDVLSATSGASENYKISKSKRTIVDDHLRYIPDRYDASSFKYEADLYNPRFDYVAPEEKTENYERYETLEDPEDDVDLKKALVLMRSFGTRLNIVKNNKDIINLN